MWGTMNIQYEESGCIFKLDTAHTSDIIAVTSEIIERARLKFWMYAGILQYSHFIQYTGFMLENRRYRQSACCHGNPSAEFQLGIKTWRGF